LQNALCYPKIIPTISNAAIVFSNLYQTNPVLLSISLVRVIALAMF
jgi:hypothetical protein